MSLTPESAAMQTVPEALPAPQRRPRRWLLLGFAVLSLAIGGFLIVFPWLDIWDLNSVQDLIPGAQAIWDDPSLRGGLTGLGLVNIYIAVVQIFRFARRRY